MSITHEPPSSQTETDRGRLRIGGIVAALALAALALGIGGTLGTWQWQRAHERSAPVEPDPRAPLADVMRPGEGGRGEGRLVAVDGVWGEAPVGLVTGKEIDGQPAVLLVLPLEIAADDTGTGAPATLPVLAGWLPEEQAASAVPASGTQATLTGYVRGGEGVSPPPDEPPVDNAVWLGSMSTAVLAQHWPAPIYSYLVVADQPAPGWNALPPPPEQRRLDLQSATYAIEWWLFGVFAAALALRWIRDNGRAKPAEEDA